MLDAGRAHLLDVPHLTLFPGMSLALLVLGFNFLGDESRMSSIRGRHGGRRPNAFRKRVDP
jgi:ABC-type dipeptide/oligopeptide/nickel transport system permease subunit